MNFPEGRLLVEVVYALPERQWRRVVSVPEGSTVASAIAASEWALGFPAEALDASRVGVFGRVTGLAHVLRAGDRVEIYRPLRLDPMEQRRQRALRR